MEDYKDKILEATHGGYNFFAKIIPNFPVRPGKMFKTGLRNENTASANYKIMNGVVFVKDFGDNGRFAKASNCFDYAMQEYGLSFIDACRHIADTCGVDLGEGKKKTYTPPKDSLTNLSESMIAYFAKRGISKQVLTINGICMQENKFMAQAKSNLNVIAYRFLENGKHINTKFKGFYKKEGKNTKCMGLVAGGKLNFYGIDQIKDSESVIITEGEEDKLSFDECQKHLTNPIPSISVPNGAANLTFWANAWEILQKVKTFYIAVDNDENGHKLQVELMRRIGKYNCKIVDFRGYKDANEVLVAESPEVLLECLNTSEIPKIDGVVTVGDSYNDIMDLYINGVERGKTCDLGEFDKMMSFKTKQITIVTGITNHGKSIFLNQLCLKLSQLHDWKFGFYSPEWAEFRRLIKEFVVSKEGKRFPTPEEAQEMKNTGRQYPNVVGLEALENSLDWLSTQMFYLDMKTPSIQNLEDAIKGIVQKYGVNAIVIDPFNRIKRDGSQSDLNGINDILTRLNQLKVELDIHIFLVAHPRKMLKNRREEYYVDGQMKTVALFDVPSIYDVAHSSDFPNQADNVLTVYRNMVSTKTEVYVQKIKFEEIGFIGSCEFYFDKTTRRFRDIPEPTFAENPESFPVQMAQSNEQLAKKLSDAMQVENNDECPF